MAAMAGLLVVIVKHMAKEKAPIRGLRKIGANGLLQSAYQPL